MLEVGLYSGPAFTAMDGKGRFSIPASMRHVVQASSGGQNRLCLTKHEDFNCVIGFGHSYQQAMRADIDREEQLASARGEGYSRAAAMQRKFGLLEDVPFDEGGRFFISPFLKKLCGIEDIVFINGSGDYFELWNPHALIATDGVYDALKLAAEFALEEWEKNPKNVRGSK
ncbi:division/cell wall cluster transcriptional repressor MraZ [Rhizorhapis sp. SPR117]|uniref:division/cell wall cluster transcriptional repressor MraZ n=1 Tax=Rhizorhapis sp. SPR117 TaxID=2912611 RepID=UPI001F3E41E9|nr:division/cell wall cluster transcriptional repressor MraZ [Rhizorhapis sp. SPR117]